MYVITVPPYTVNDSQLMLSQTEQHLTSCVQQWVDWGEVSERVTGWLKDVDVELRRVDLKPTVEEKLATLQHLRVSTAPAR